MLPAAQMLLQSLCAFLRSTQLQTAEICWQLVGMDRSLREVGVRSASSHSDWKSWHQLTGICFDQLQLATGVEGLILSCRNLHPGQPENSDLFHPGRQRGTLAHLLDRLRSRLGLQAIEKVGCRDEHLPEFAVHVSSDCSGGEPGTPGHTGAQRPFWLMPRPQPLRQSRQRLYWNGALTLLHGPERIEDNWWQEAVSRDYYIAGDGSGQQYWVFRDRLASRGISTGVCLTSAGNIPPTRDCTICTTASSAGGLEAAGRSSVQACDLLQPARPGWVFLGLPHRPHKFIRLRLRPKTGLDGIAGVKGADPVVGGAVNQQLALPCPLHQLAELAVVRQVGLAKSTGRYWYSMPCPPRYAAHRRLRTGWTRAAD